MWDKRAPLLTANRTARTRIGRIVGSKPERLCPDEKNKLHGQKAQSQHCYSGEQWAKRQSASFCRSRDSFAIRFRVAPHSPHNWDMEPLRARAIT
jgi:hypothetical protein